MVSQKNHLSSSLTSQKEGSIHSNLTFPFLVLSSIVSKSINNISLELSSHIEKEKSFYKSGSVPFFFTLYTDKLSIYMM